MKLYETKENHCISPFDKLTATEGGLTKREYFAAMAMQGGVMPKNARSFIQRLKIFFGITADVSVVGPKAECLAKRSVEYADALINELNKDTK